MHVLLHPNMPCDMRVFFARDTEKCFQSTLHRYALILELPLSLRDLSAVDRSSNASLASMYPHDRISTLFLKILLLPKKHRKADNSPINQQPANNRHRHRRNGNQTAMSQRDRESYAKSPHTLAINLQPPKNLFPPRSPYHTYQHP